MPMSINNNNAIAQSLTSMNRHSDNMSVHLNRVSTGLKINKSKDNAAAYAVSQHLQADLRSYKSATHNVRTASDALSLSDGAVASTVQILQTIREHALAAAGGTYSASDLQATQKEIHHLIEQIDDNSLVSYNGIYMVDGSKHAKTKSTATNQIMTNYSLSASTASDTALSSLADRDGNSLGIKVSDTVTVSFYKGNGTFSISTTQVTSTTTLGSILTDASAKVASVVSATQTDGRVHSDTSGTDSTNLYSNSRGETINLSPDRKAGMYLVIDGATSFDAQISGLSITVSNKDNTANSKANQYLNAFETSIFASKVLTDDKSMKFNTGILSNSYVTVNFEDMSANAFGLKSSDGNSEISVVDVDKANAAVKAIDNAINRAIMQQAEIGAIQMRLEYTEDNLLVAEENTQAAQSDIIDADMAQEVSEYMKSNVLLQASQAMLAQANQRSGDVLYLLGGSSS